MNWNDASDIELVRVFKSGDLDAFDAIVRRFEDRIFRLAKVYLYDDQLAADVTQEVFVRSFKGLRRFRFKAEPFTWLYRATRNVCHEYNRVRRSETLVDEPPDTRQAPERLAQDEDSARQIRALVEKLAPRQREVVMLRIFEELSVKQTAAAMGCREGTVKALLHKATRALEGRARGLGLHNE